jgi:hypothetical protein
MITLLASFFFPWWSFWTGARGTEAGGGCGATVGPCHACCWWWGWVALHRVASHCLNHAANYSCDFATIRHTRRRRWIMGLGSCFGHHNIRASNDGHIEAQSSCQRVISFCCCCCCCCCNPKAHGGHVGHPRPKKDRKFPTTFF